MKIIILLVLIAKLTSAIVVNIPSLGKLEGSTKTSLKNRTFYSFEGIPYARPPVGKYRFREPVPLKPWYGVWKTQTIYKCMQSYQYTPVGGDFVIGDEDCLYLNIYSPKLDENANLDVIVYIHGGAFMFNWGGLHGPDYILDKNVVFINLNYRLGPLGFLSTESEVVPGNNGLKDQILALKFIKDNVKYFGGNPSSITIMGMSAGGASVHFHYLSPKSRGLFQRGISQSGTMLNPWVLIENPLEKTRKLANHLGCGTTTDKEMVDCLKRRPGRQIVEAVKIFQPWLYNPFSPFGVVVDSWSSDPVLPEHPFKLLKNKKIADLPWMASYTNSEGLYPAADFYFDEQYLEDIDSRWDELLPFILDYNYTIKAELQDTVSQEIRRKFLGAKRVTKETFLDFVKILSERLFIAGIQKAVRMHNAGVRSDVFLYYFTYRGAHSKSEPRAGTNKDFGASHGDDTSYVLKTNVDTVSTENDRAMVDLFTEIVASFAKTGKPKVPVEWPALSKTDENQFTYLKIANVTGLAMETSILDNGRFWDSLPFKENEKLFSSIKTEL